MLVTIGGMSTDYYGEPIGQYWVDDEYECSICLETLTDCTCLDNLKPSHADAGE